MKKQRKTISSSVKLEEIQAEARIDIVGFFNSDQLNSVLSWVICQLLPLSGTEQQNILSSRPKLVDHTS